MKTLLCNPSMLVVAIGLLLPQTLVAKVSEETLKNLNEAYQGESNAVNRYQKFADKAAAEGNKQVAKLFRAAAASEAVHRDTHKAAISELGGTVGPIALAEVQVGTTAENLQAAIQGETQERDVMYPGFLATAKADDAPPAIRAIEFALAAEKEHARLYQEARETLGNNASADYYVCGICGMTVTELPAKRCRSCHRSRDEYNKIS